MDGQFDDAYFYTLNNGSTSTKSIDNGLVHVEVDADGVYTITLEPPVVNARYVGFLNSNSFGL